MKTLRVIMSVSAIVLIVMAIIFIFAPIYRAMAENRKYKKAEKEVTILSQAVRMHAADNNNISPYGKNLTQFASYVNGSIPKDPWNRDYIYQCPGKIHPTGYDIICYGADGLPGGEDAAKDIVIGEDRTIEIEIKKVSKVLCPDCQKELMKKEEIIKSSYQDAEQYKTPNGQRIQTVSLTSSYRCNACEEKYEIKNKIPILLDKTKKEIFNIYGTPDSSIAGGFMVWHLNWVYDNKPRPGFKTEIDFQGKGNGLYGYDFTNARVCKVDTYTRGNNFRPSELLPKKILNREPDKIIVNTMDNWLKLVWNFKKDKFVLVVTSADMTKVYTESKKVNLRTGDVTTEYNPISTNWRNDFVVWGFSQQGPMEY